MKGVPIRSWWLTHGCIEDLIIWVKFKIEAIKIHATIPLKVATCHASITSIFVYSLLLFYESNQKAREKKDLKSYLETYS